MKQALQELEGPQRIMPLFKGDQIPRRGVGKPAHTIFPKSKPVPDEGENEEKRTTTITSHIFATNGLERTDSLCLHQNPSWVAVPVQKQLASLAI